LFEAFHQAYTLMSSQKARDAFEMAREPKMAGEVWADRFAKAAFWRAD